MTIVDKKLTVEVQKYLTKIKVDNNLNFNEFEKVVCDACNNVSREFGDKEK